MKTDVLVIGGGIAGMHCANEAAKYCSVTVVSDGSCSFADMHGLHLPSDKYKSAEAFAEETLKAGCYINKKSLVGVLSREAFGLSEENLGVCSFSPECTVLSNVRAMRLKLSGDRVTGAYCFDRLSRRWFFISASSVVLAAGGFERIFSDAEDAYASDAMAMAYHVGADLIDMEFIGFEDGCALTFGGIEINERCETKVKGLFACGSVAGGLHGACSLPGNMTLEAIVFGKIAGQSAAEFSQLSGKVRNSIQETDDCPAPFDAGEYLEKVRSAAESGLRCPRCRENMQQALKTVMKIADASEKYPESFDAVRVHNDAITVSAALWLAFSRLSSVGTHIRSDDMYEESQLYNRYCYKRFGNLYTEKGSFFNREIMTLQA